ncbi:hypothetical protein VPHD479_0228 [Vibrio phage D479]
MSETKRKQKVEYLSGFSIPTRPLTDEEANREITWERFRDFHYTVGEDFLDQTSEGNADIFAGWLLHKYPHLNKEILELANARFADVASFMDLFGFDDDKDIDVLYVEFAEFCNLTGALKRRVNETLIIIDEYYSKS